MSVSFGNSAMNMFYLGNTAMQYIYQGDALIWPTASVAPSTLYRVELHDWASTPQDAATRLDGFTYVDGQKIGNITAITSSTQYYIDTDAFRLDATLTRFRDVDGGCTSVQSRGLYGIFTLREVYLPECGPIYEYGIGPGSGTNFQTLYIPKAYGTIHNAINAGNSSNGTLTIKSSGPWPFNMPFSSNDLTSFSLRGWSIIQV
jgi:hypothetical protein